MSLSKKYNLRDTNNVIVIKKIYNNDFSEIEKVFHKNNPEIFFARKRFFLKNLLKITKIQLEEFDKNLRLLQHNNHSNIIRMFCYDLNVKSNVFTIFMKFYEKGSIQDILNTMKQPFTASQIKVWISKLLSALHYLHERYCAHRNLRLSSFLLDTDNNILISGFGKHITSCNYQYEIMRTTLFKDIIYQAPEMSNICASVWPYNARQTDIWAMGICLFMMINIEPPFTEDLYHNNPIQFLQNQRNSEYSFSPQYCTSENESLRHLCKYFLEPAPGKRISALQALTHNSLFQQ